MKYVGLLALALAAVPATTFAQDMPPGAAPPGAPPAAMQQMHEHMMQLRQTTRAQMLGALTPQHRTLLSTVVGQLAVSSTPNVQAAAQQLDAALTPQESQAILAAENSWRSEMRTAMQNAAPAGATNLPARNDAGAARTPDAGMALIHAALGFGGGMRPPHVP